LRKLREQITKADKPWCWMLDHDRLGVVRAFTLSAIMHQHGVEYDVLLDNFETGLGRYQKIPKKVIEQTIQDMLQADPDQITEDVGAVETFLKEEPEKRLAFLLADRCKIDQPEQARAVLLAEKLWGSSAAWRSCPCSSTSLRTGTRRSTNRSSTPSTMKGQKARSMPCRSPRVVQRHSGPRYLPRTGVQSSSSKLPTRLRRRSARSRFSSPTSLSSTSSIGSGTRRGQTGSTTTQAA
jgi:hypothetical protein